MPAELGQSWMWTVVGTAFVVVVAALVRTKRKPRPLPHEDLLLIIVSKIDVRCCSFWNTALDGRKVDQAGRNFVAVLMATLSVGSIQGVRSADIIDFGIRFVNDLSFSHFASRSVVRRGLESFIIELLAALRAPPHVKLWELIQYAVVAPLGTTLDEDSPLREEFGDICANIFAKTSTLSIVSGTSPPWMNRDA